jgi:hypothetical protein
LSKNYSLDFNDPQDNGCADWTDNDTIAWNLVIDPSNAKLSVGQCLTCITDNIILWSAAQFIEGTNNVITLLSGSPDSDDLWDWILTDIRIQQTIPAWQPAEGEYIIPLSLSITAQ